MGKRLSPVAVGLFVLGGLVIALGAVVILASSSLFSKKIDCVLFFSGDVNGLRVGSSVKFRGVEIGSVTSILLSLPQDENQARHPQVFSITIPVLIELDEARIVRHGYNFRDPRATIQAMVGEGLRGQLALESLVTGVLYVALDFHPGSRANFVPLPDERYIQIPTVPSQTEQFQNDLNDVIHNLQRLDVQHLIASTTQTLDAAHQLFASPSLRAGLQALPAAVRSLNSSAASINQASLKISQLAVTLREQSIALGPSLRATSENAARTLEEARKAMIQIQAVIQPNSPLNYRLVNTLDQLSGAAVAVRQLADYLRRNPSALVRGTTVGQ